MPNASRRDRDERPKAVNRHRWVFEPLEDLPGFVERRMFGALAGYLNGLLVLVLCDGEEPWRGVMVPAERENHAALIAAFPVLSPHPILGKWLYLPEACATFERDAEQIVARIRRLDPLIGTVPVRKKRKARVRTKSSAEASPPKLRRSK
jgi:hypothetical protein